MRPLYVALLASLALSACATPEPSAQEVNAAQIKAQADLRAKQRQEMGPAKWDALQAAIREHEAQQRYEMLFGACMNRFPVPITEWQDGEIRRRCAAETDRIIHPAREIAPHVWVPR